MIAITQESEAKAIFNPEIYSTFPYWSTVSGESGETLTDTIPVRNDTIPPGERQVDTIPPTKQRIDTFSLKMSPDTLDAPVNYKAADSAVIMVKDQVMFLYGRDVKTVTTYKDIVLKAPIVKLDQKSNILTAMGIRNEKGVMISRAEFEQGEQKFQSDSMQYNFKTQRGLTKNTYTQEGELYIIAGTAKKVNATTMFIREGYYTTCDLDDPHFAFKTNKLKVINEKLAVSGPTHPEFEHVPIPIYLPFGMYPLTKGRRSGFNPPTPTVNEQFGIGLEDFGYYHVLNDYVDVNTRASVYSYGGWRVSVMPAYRKRYKYQGSFNLQVQHTKVAFKGDPDYSVNNSFNLSWSHMVDPKARPGTSFSANVNAGSTKFNRLVPNSPIRNITNQMYSSITYARYWKDKPYSMQMSANHNQNNNTGLVNLTLPDVGFTVTTLYPFQRKDMIGTPKWYERFGVGYSGVARNQLSFFDTGKVVFSKLIDTMQWGARHNFPISLQLPPIMGGKVFMSPGVSYEETWLTRRLQRQWNTTTKKVDTLSYSRGLFIDRHMSFNAGLNTNIYGLFNFKKFAIRHVIRPNISMSYTPNMSKKYYDVIQVDTSGYRQALSQFAMSGVIFSGYGYGKFGGMTFGVDNNFEMKKFKKDSAGQDKKISLIDGFSINSGYNFLQDSMKLLPLSISLRSTLFSKISITASGMLNPYKVNDRGFPINRYAWDGGKFNPGRLENFSVAMSTSFQSKPRDEKKAANNRNAVTNINDPSLLTDRESLVEYMNKNPAEFVDFNIPWSINLSYSLSVTKYFSIPDQEFISNVTSSVNFSNSFSLTPKWNFSTNGFFDFDTKKLTMFTMSINRDMHCWQMSISTTPIGDFRYFSITISPKGEILRDLKVSRTRTFYSF